MGSKSNTSRTKEQQRTTEAKALLLEKLEDNLGVLTISCKQAGISRKQYYEWRKNDAAFCAKADEIQEVALDFVEHQLYKNVESGDTQSIIFYLKTKGKGRGYTERTDLNIKSENKVELTLGNMSPEDIAYFVAEIQQNKEKE